MPKEVSHLSTKDYRGVFWRENPGKTKCTALEDGRRHCEQLQQGILKSRMQYTIQHLPFKITTISNVTAKNSSTPAHTHTHTQGSKRVNKKRV